MQYVPWTWCCVIRRFSYMCGCLGGRGVVLYLYVCGRVRGSDTHLPGSSTPFLHLPTCSPERCLPLAHLGNMLFDEFVICKIENQWKVNITFWRQSAFYKHVWAHETFCFLCGFRSKRAIYADYPAMSLIFGYWQIKIRNTNQLSWAIN